MKSRFFNRMNERHFIRKCYRFDTRRYLTHSCPLTPASADELRGEMAVATHVVEKGLTMPDMRWGFGRERILSLIALCNTFRTRYGATDEVLLQAISVLKEYRGRHLDAGQQLDDTLLSSLSALLDAFPAVPPSQQPHTDHTRFFAEAEAPFPAFSGSRHSIRHFGPESIPTATLQETIRLAQNAPSACNRQATRAYIIQTPGLVHDILALQNGNRGFGQTVDKLIILTSDLSYYKGGKSRNLCYIDAGIWAMNLLYALHYHHVGACPLNWCDSPGDDARIRSLLSIPANETVALVIACGSVPDDDIALASSRRVDADSITHIL